MTLRGRTFVLLFTMPLVSILCGCSSPAAVAPTDMRPTSTSALPGQAILQIAEITSPALADNLIGDSDTREFVVYLPPGYATSDRRYPVVYVLHYYTGDEWSLVEPLQAAVDYLVYTGAMQPIMLVFPNANNRFRGSWHFQSATIGDYETYITRNLVDYIDANYRTIPHRDSRGVTGCSMGGDGAFHLGFGYADIFGVAAPVSGIYDFENFPLWDEAAQRLTDIPTNFDEFDQLPWQAQSLMAITASAAPAADNPPFYLDMPFELVGGQGKIVSDVREKVDEFGAVHEVYNFLEQPARLNGLLIYHGTADDIAPAANARTLATLLAELGIEHEYLEVPGGHCDLDYKPVMQFMSEHLMFEESR